MCMGTDQEDRCSTPFVQIEIGSIQKEREQFDLIGKSLLSIHE